MITLQSVPLDQKVTISHDAAVAWDETPFLKEGDVLTVEQLLSCMLVHSSNGSAVALAQGVAGSTDAFVVKMNAKAQELGMANTHYVNPNGLDTAGHYSTATDISVLARYAMQSAEFRKLVSQKSYTLVVPGRAPVVFDSTNKLMLRAGWVNGIKTGLTPKANQCLVVSGTKDGVTMVSVVLGQPVTNVCWDESQSLLEYGLAQYKHVTFLKSGVTVAEAAIPYSNEKLDLVTRTSLEMDLFKEDEVAASVKIDKQLTLPVRAGQKCGTIVLSMRGQIVGSVDLVADTSVGKITLGTKISHLWHRLAG
jgi:D-alanyl-D-alanine carboxypeptidase